VERVAGTAEASGPSEARPASGAKADADRFLLAALLYPGLVVLALALQVGLSNGLLESSATLWRELAWSHSTPWEQGLSAPDCYRPLFRALVLAATGLVTDVEAPPELQRDVSYGVFVALTGMSLLAAAASFDLLLGRLGFGGRERLAGTALLLLGFPVLFSHDLPVNVRQDFATWALLALTLAAVAGDRPLVAGLIASVGVACHEACLLGVLPLALVSRRPRREVAAAFALPIAAFVLIRLVVQPAEPEPSLLARVDEATLPLRLKPLEALLFAFATFGVLWAAAGLRLLDRTPPRHPLLAPRVVGVCAVAVVGFGWTLGAVREARIAYLLAPFVVPLALDLVRTGRLARLRPSPAIAAGLVALALGAAAVLWARGDITRVLWLRGDPAPGEPVETRWTATGELNPGVAPRVLFGDDPGPPLPADAPVPLQALRVAVDAALEDDAFVETEWLTIEEAWAGLDPAVVEQARAALSAGSAPRRALATALGQGLRFDEVAHALQPEGVTLYSGSPLQGPFVTLHLALLAALLVAVATRRVEPGAEGVAAWTIEHGGRPVGRATGQEIVDASWSCWRVEPRGPEEAVLLVERDRWERGEFAFRDPATGRPGASFAGGRTPAADDLRVHLRWFRWEDDGTPRGAP
jgi:hypothetical protein